MRKGILLLTVLVFLSINVSAIECFQQTANVSNSCGGLNTGVYAFNGSWTNDASCYDGDYGTQGHPNLAINNEGDFFVNYSKPSLANSAKWEINDWGGLLNITLPEECFNDTVELKAITLYLGVGDYYVNWSCMNKTSRLWTVVRNISSGTGDIWEEAIIWSMDINLNNFTHNSTTYETSIEYFSANVSYSNDYWASISANFYYNGTSYLASKSVSGNEAIFSKTLDIPLITSQAAQNHTFYWEFILTNDTGDYFFNSTKYNQTVDWLTFTRCNATYPSVDAFVNYTVYNETNLTRTNFSMDAYFKYWLGDGSIFKNKTLDSESNESIMMCANLNKTLNIDAIVNIEYPGFDERTYYFDDEAYTNATTEIWLYLLDGVGSDIIIQVRDSGLSPVKGYLIDIERFYPELNQYKKVIMEKTDIYGQFVANLVQNIVKYKFTFYDTEGAKVKETGDMTIACRTTICVLPFVIEDTTNDTERFYNISDYDWSFAFTNSTKTFTFTWNDVSGLSATNRLEVTRYLWNGTTTVCNTTSTDASGVLTCNVGSSSASYQAQVFRKVGSGEWRRIGWLSETVGEESSIFDIEGLMWSFILLMTLMVLGYWYPPIGVTLYLVGFLVLSRLHLIYSNPLILIINLAIGVAFIWAFKRRYQ